MRRAEPPPRPPLRLLPLLLAVLGLALVPWLTKLYESGALSRSPRETWSSSVASAIAIAFGVWVIVLLRRERGTHQRHLSDLEALTLADPLTGLGNRRALERELARTMLRSRRLDHPLALLYMDVDDLKHVNDRFGHAAGDETLRAVAHAVRHCSREGTDSGYRVGGDEFVLIVLAGRAGSEILAGMAKSDDKTTSRIAQVRDERPSLVAVRAERRRDRESGQIALRRRGQGRRHEPVAGAVRVGVQELVLLLAEARVDVDQ